MRSSRASSIRGFRGLMGRGEGDREAYRAVRSSTIMYQEIILDHYRHPHHKGLREPYGAEVHHMNPTCGDEVTLRVDLIGRRGRRGRRGCTKRVGGLLDLPGVRVGDGGPGDRQAGGRGAEGGDAFLELMQSKRSGWSRTRTCSRTRSRSRGVEVPGAGQVRVARWMACKDALVQALATTYERRKEDEECRGPRDAVICAPDRAQDYQRQAGAWNRGAA